MNNSPHSGHRKRMKEEFREFGGDRFSEHQLVELLLFFAIPQGDTNVLAHRLIDRFGSVHGLLQATYDQLMDIDGVGSHTATLIGLCGDLVKRHGLTERPTGTVLQTTEDIGAFLLPHFWRCDKEKLLMISINDRCEAINVTEISSGTPNATAVNTKLILRQAVLDGATEVVLAHNHPSGHPLPSREDINSTIQLRKDLKSVDVRLLDHIIVSDTDYISMRETASLAMIFA